MTQTENFFPSTYRYLWFGGCININFVQGHDLWLITQHPNDRRDERLNLSRSSFSTIEEAHAFLVDNVPNL